jgi:hypothetical protein
MGPAAARLRAVGILQEHAPEEVGGGTSVTGREKLPALPKERSLAASVG